MDNENKNFEEMNDVNTTEEKKPTFKQKFLKELREWVVSLAVAVLVVFLLKSFVFTIIRVDGSSMAPTLEDDQRLFVTVADVKLSGAERGDVVICHYPGRENPPLLGFIKSKTCFVKRVVAVEGDTVSRDADNITYVTYGDTGETVALDAHVNIRHRGTEYSYTLKEDEYFVVGDNRGNSHDSRDWFDSSIDAEGEADYADPDDPENPRYDITADVGPITGDMLVGKVRFVLWPIDNIGGVE